MLVLHYTGMPNAEAALERMLDAGAKVSAHYMIDEDGSLLSLVDEDMRAWHCGEAYWRGSSDINGRSIGIELVNPGHEWGYRAFPEAQMAVLEMLIGDIFSRHDIAPGNVVGHSDIAPRRKQDPGELFDWPRLARAGIGLWPEADADAADAARAAEMLAAIGYETVDPAMTVAAFQRRYRQTRINGVVDGETAALVARLHAMTAA